VGTQNGLRQPQERVVGYEGVEEVEIYTVSVFCFFSMLLFSG
jgi:hypothetical protein